MLKNASPNGYSSKVRGWLVVGNCRHELAQVGPDFCIVREPLAFSQSQAELVVEIDGDQQSTSIQIASDHAFDGNRISFARQ